MKTLGTLPQRREKGLLLEDLPTETLVYDTTNNKVHCLNPVARLVWRHCNGGTTPAEMVEIIRKEFNTPADEAVVRLTLEKLAQAGLLETEERAWLANPTSRRQAVKTLAGFGIAAAAALVATIVAPSVAQAASIGAACNHNADCTSNNCCQATAPPRPTPCGTCFPNGASCPNGNC
jgi:hypothetical protein